MYMIVPFDYVSSAVAPAASSFFLISSASSLAAASLTALGALSTSSSLLQAKTCERANFLNDSDLIATGFDQDNVELILFRSSFFSSSGTASSSNCNRSSSANAPLLFESLTRSGLQAQFVQRAIRLPDLLDIGHDF